MNSFRALAAACNTGSWQQKWSCGWHQPTTAAVSAGHAFGHSVLPWLICAAVVVLIFHRGRRGHREATRGVPARRAWPEAKPVPGRK